jgi:hypothetical protein
MLNRAMTGSSTLPWRVRRRKRGLTHKVQKEKEEKTRYSGFATERTQQQDKQTRTEVSK